MGFIYGLAVFLVIFEGIIIECEGAGGGDSSNTPPLPNDAWELIYGRTDFRTRARPVLSKLVDTGLFQDHIILIAPRLERSAYEFWQYSNLYLRFGMPEEVISLFKNYGNQVKRVEIWYEDEKQYEEFNKIIIDHIKIYGKNFEELRINTMNDARFWKEILDGEEKFDFPEVKNFRIDGTSMRKDFKLNVIFPMLEIFTLHGRVADVNCLANVETLKELTVHTRVKKDGKLRSIQDDQLQHIIKKNKNITKISLAMPNMAKTMHSIAENLKQLTTLQLETYNRYSLLQENNYNTVYQLPSVTHFEISFDARDDLIDFENLSFVMPHLKELTLKGFYTVDQIVDFVEHFEELEKVEISGSDFNIAKCIEKLKDIKEFTTFLYENRFYSLKNVLPNFDEHSKLQILKFRYIVQNLDKTREADMMKFKNHLETSTKSTWTQSYWEQSGTHYGYLIFKREP